MKNYDKKVKGTRILLSDYLLLKGFAQRAGVSMAEALHKIITGQDDKAPVHTAQILMPVTMAESMPVTRARSKPVTKARSTPITVSISREVKRVNGHKRTD